MEILTKCRSNFNISSNGETVFVDHKHDTDSFQGQQQNEEEEKNVSPKDSGHCKFFDNSSTSVCSSCVKNDIDIFYEDIKRETGEEKLCESIGFCEVCYQSFGAETDFYKSSSYTSECSCQNENEPLYYNMCGQDMTLDVTPPLFDFATASTLKPLQVKDETISEDEVTKEQDSSAVPQRLPGRPIKNCYEKKLKISLERLETNLFLEKRKHQYRNYSKSLTRYKVGIGHREERRFHCKFCSKAFKRPYQLRVHERIHTGEKPFRCEICLKSFTHSTTLKAHRSVHTGEKLFNCKICSMSFTRADSAKRHERIHADNLFRCKICSKAFTTPGYLTFHKRIHTGEKSFQCKVCLKFFMQMTHLKRHMGCHTGEKPFCCKFCSKAFRQKNTLRNHEMVHTGEKPFSCNICSKSFRQVHHLQEHKKAHSSQKSFHCKICSKSYNLKDSLKRHEKGHNDNDKHATKNGNMKKI